ncbi:amino acid adenylation domain-containing protein [Acidobacteriota bacterium]
MQLKDITGADQKAKYEKYWLDKLSGDLTRCTFPYDYKETVSNVRIIDSVEFRFSGEIFSRLWRFSHESEVNLYLFLASGLIALLGKYAYTSTGSKDIILGSPILFEMRKGVESKPLNTVLPLRNQFDENVSFKELCINLGKIVSEANQYKDFPVEELIDKLNMKVLGDDFPLFDVAVSLENIQDRRYIRHLNVNMIFSFFRTAKYIDGVVEYNSSLYERRSVKRIINQFTKLLESVLSNIRMPLYKIDIFSPEEKKHLLEDLNNTQTDYPKNKTIQEIFELQVEKTPHNTALLFKDKQFTYLCLNQKSNQLARLLRDKGIKPDQFAGLMVERSMEMMIAMFAILKAGGAYLPIDPDYPRDRVLYLLADSSSQLLLTQEKFIDIIDFDGETIDLEEKSLYHGETRNPPLVNSPTHLAYAIYTSGSTGKPKGVMIEHWSVINLAYSQKAAFNIQKIDKVLQFSTISFDASVEQIYITLFSGAALVLIDKITLLDMKKFENFIDDQALAHIHAVPLFVGSIPVKKYSGLERMIAGGDACPSSLVKKWIKYCDFCNEYGPTETTVTSIQLPVKKEENFKELSIGRPLNNTFLYILSKYWELVPQGVAGELCIGGDGVARGYMNRPGLTAEKFIPNLFVEKGQNQRMYKTGDLARWLPDGNIDFLGRIDFQVKIRGFRIETGEIENQIIAQKEQKIKEVVVCAREDREGDKYLCAYLAADIIIDILALTATLSKNLPEYMIPSYFVQIDKIPLTQSGKVNRKELPDPKQKSRDEIYSAPRNEIEEKLAEIWAQLLHMKKNIISIDDNFFRLGGHSLKATVMMTEIHKLLNVKVIMRHVFDMPTIRQLAEYIKGAKEEKYTSIPLTEKKEYYPQTSAQKRLYFIHQLEDNSVMYNMQMMDVYCKGIEKERLEQAFRKLIQRHESLRTTFFTKDGEAVQRVHDFEEIGSKFTIDYWETQEDAMIYSDQEGKEWTKVTGLPFEHVVEEFVKPFDISTAPILRAGLIRIWGNTQLLMMDMHHIMSDGVSEVLIIKDLWALYEEKELPRLYVQYKDFAEWITSEKLEIEINKHEPYWLDEFQGEIPVLSLPYNYPRPAKMGFYGESSYFEISKDEANQLYTLALDQGVTLYMVLFAAYNVLLSRLSGQEDIVVGTISAGRGHADAHEIVGMFVDTLAVRSYPAAQLTFINFLGGVKHKVLSAFEHQDYPLERLASKVARRSDAGRNPLFDVVFSLENETERTDQYLLEVLMLEKDIPYRFDIKKSKFDFMLTAVETENEMQFIIEYNTQLFKRETIERFAKYYGKILFSICSDVNQKIGGIDLITRKEKNKILFEFNDTKVDYPTDQTLHELFVQHAAKTPGNIALKFHHDTLTYRQVNEKASQLAYRLKEKGVKPNHMVGIMVERSMEMIIGIFAVLKAGGAYVPIDPKYPEDRIRYLFKDSDSKLLLTQTRHMDFARTLEFEGEVFNLEDQSLYQDEKPALQIVDSPKDLAYIIYTSGSTGKPKGVMIEHVSAVNLLLTLDKMYPLEKSDAYLLKTAFLFDVSVSEIFGWFWRGGRLVVLEPGGEKNPLLMMDIIQQDKITHLNFVPSMFNAFVSILDRENVTKLASLRYIFLAGEAIWPDSIIKFRELNSSIIIDNLYGPTEATVYASWYPVAKWQGKGSISIGKPVDNLKLYILSSNNNTKPRLQPMGIAGELTISGIGLARGYLNRPELTSEKFVDNLYASCDGLSDTFQKIYHTGDLTRWSSDGNIEYLGRIDSQVKVRGFRIELGEIETQLSKIDEIKEAAVLVRANQEGEKYLCAYFLSDKKIDPASLREELSKDLPNYMIPSYFMQLEKMPLNPSGKLDRKALPEPEAEILTREYVAPTNEIETAFSKVWSEVLNIKKIGIDDNFFEIGGDSIKTILISAKLMKQGIDINVNDFFSYSTIRELAKQAKTGEQLVKTGAPVVTRDEELIAKLIEKDYEKYLQLVNREKWPEFTYNNDYKHILLTGATGYLGAYLVHELLDITNAKLYLPIRGASQEDAEQRLKKRLVFYFGDRFLNTNANRIIVLKADLGEKHLGIHEPKYNELCELVEAVLHSAANVKHFGLYDQFYKDNVQATEGVMDFSITGKHKDFHFISTIDTGRGDIQGKDYLLFNEYCHDEGQKIEEVYLKSKLEAERRVLAYRKKGLNTSIYRAANMTFNSQTGRFQKNIEDNFFYSMLKAFVKVGFWSNSMMELEFDLSFVNEAARAIVSLMKKKELENQTYHICNPYTLTWKDMVLLVKETGLVSPNINMKPDEIQINLSQYEGRSEYEKMIERVNVYSWEWEKKEGTITVPKMDRTVKLLEKIGFQWSKVNTQHIKKMITHCKDVGFL